MQDNKYQITKTVRFKLEPKEEELPSIKKELLKIQDENDNEVNLEDYLNSKSNDDDTNMSELLTLKKQIQDILDKFLHLIFKTDTNNHIIKKDTGFEWRNIDIKYTFLRNYLKYSFYRFKEEKYANVSGKDIPKTYKLYDENLQFFRDEIIGGEHKLGDSLIQRFEEIIAKIDEFNERKYINQYEKQRFADIALVIGSLSQVNNLEFIKELVCSLVIPNTDKDGLDDKKKELQIAIDKVEETVTKKMSFYVPFKSSMGFQTSGGSFNYYTINKDAKALEKEEKKLRDSFKDTYYDNKNGAIIATLNLTNKVVVDFYVDRKIELLDKEARTPQKKEEIRNAIVEQLGLTSNTINQKLSLNIEETYKFIKLWKGVQKTLFETALKNYGNLDSKNFADNSVLFKFDNYIPKKQAPIPAEKLFSDLQRMEEKLKKYSDEKSDSKTTQERKDQLSKKIKDTKKDIGNIFLERKGMNNYTKLCNYFKALAIQYGQMKAQLAGIKKDKISARLLHYWCVILEENKKKYLYMIPRNSQDNIKKAYNDIKQNSPSNSQTGDCKLFYFESLTLSALRKLCFKERNNSFSEKFPLWFPKCEQIKTQKKIDEFGHVVTQLVKNKHTGEMEEKPVFENVPTTESDRIGYFQFALKQLIKENILQIDPKCSLVTNKPYQFNNSLEQFEIELNRHCYKKAVFVNNGYGNKLMQKFKAIRFEITSKDLESNSKMNPRQCFTTKLWSNFWEDNANMKQAYPIRLNPEVKIFWRFAKPSRIHKYSDNPDRDIDSMHNRYKAEQFTVAFTFIENALTPRLDYSFVVHKTQETNGNIITKKEYNVDANIQKFNTTFNQNHNTAFSIGIDVGNNELASMAIVDNNRMPIKLNALEIKKNKMGYFKVNNRKKMYYLEDSKSLKYFTDENLYNKVFADNKYQETLDEHFDNNNGNYSVKPNKIKCFKEGFQIHFVIENASYFLKKELYDYTFADGLFEQTKNEIFEKKTVSSIDLTTAKIIAGEIVLNADLSTHQKLRILRAQRVISRELRVDSNVTIDSTSDPNAIRLNTKNTKTGIVLLGKNHGDYDSIMSDDMVLKTLENHLKVKSLDLVRIEDRINNYRKAMVANMVGVITFVYKYAQSLNNSKLGWIVFEGLDQNTLGSHLKKFEGNIAVPLRIALMKKLQIDFKEKTDDNGTKTGFQFTNLVPPFAEINKLTDEQKFVVKDNNNGVRQFGVIKFVTKASSSQCCPVCGIKVDPQYQYPKIGDLHSKDFKCPCGFDTKTNSKNPNDPHSTIDSTDKVAAHNIAKRGI